MIAVLRAHSAVQVNHFFVFKLHCGLELFFDVSWLNCDVVFDGFILLLHLTNLHLCCSSRFERGLQTVVFSAHFISRLAQLSLTVLTVSVAVFLDEVDLGSILRVFLFLLLINCSLLV